MKIIKFIHLTFAQAFYARALAQIDPLHPDVPEIVMKRQQLEDQARSMFE